MISMIQPLYAGNAVRIFVAPTTGAVVWKVRRKTTNTIAGHNDATAYLAYEGEDHVFIDATGLQNDVQYFYAIYYSVDGITWVAGNVRTGTPSAAYQDHTTDVMSFLRERIEAGLAVECVRGNFQTELGMIQVYTSPPLMEQGLRFPLVSIHLDSERPAERAIGENISGDEYDSIGLGWEESEGWLAQVELQVIGWSLNGDERIELRKALRRIVMANLAILSEQGFDRVEFSQSDVDSLSGEYNSPMYQVMCNFACLAPVRVGSGIPAISAVTSTLIL